VAKVVGGTLLLIGAGSAIYWRARRAPGAVR
jgi:hypothetical protein